jgi:acylphosphatase
MSATSENEATFQAWVEGGVQGIGFRYFVAHGANRLEVRGVTRNLPDGRVHVCARGSRAALESLLALLRQGPRMARVENVKVDWDAPCPDVEGFEIVGY